ncbi:MAG: ABC transporter ATP-binding protein [Planctomycetota bacterium]|nr:ABC transporter ATP-binding protein [Planctomycetota bacterium]
MIDDRMDTGYCMDTGGAAVVVESLEKSYGSGASRTPVLKGVDLVVRRGECVYLAGPSGSGKTTLLSIIGCILSADRGRVRILDEEVFSLTAKERTALRLNRLGFVFQRFHLIRGLTTLDNVCVPLTLQGIGATVARRRAMSLLDAVGLADKADAHPRNLSAGQCQRVALARAMVADPELILADEPTASLDAANGQDVMELFRRLTTEEGKTVVLVTHDQRIFRFADRVFWLENGCVVENDNEAQSETPGAGKTDSEKQLCVASCDQSNGE